MSSFLLDFDATEQARLIADGEVTASELLEASIARIEECEPLLNAVTQRFFDEARREVESNLVDGPFRGVPFLVKDFFCHMRGTPTTGSARVLRDNVIDHDSELMSRYRQAGFITLGKTNVPEMASMSTTEPVWRGITRNPWNTDHTVGGSSGGSAAAVAARYVASAHANDGAGSTRIPASCCGLFGLKPSRARITLGPDIGESLGGITAEHVLTRSVRDSAAILDATCGAMVGDPYAASSPKERFLDAVYAPRTSARIAVSFTAPDGTEVASECVAAVEQAAELCGTFGHHVTEASPPIDGAKFRSVMDNFWPMTVTRGIVAIAQQRNCQPEILVSDFEPFNQYLFAKGITRRAVDYIQDLFWFQGMARVFGQFFENYDIWLSPTLPFAPPRLGYFDAGTLGGDEAWRRVLNSFIFTAPANVTGLPSASIPMQWTGDNLPIGVQATARLNDEAILFSLAAQMEAANPWCDIYPAF